MRKIWLILLMWPLIVLPTSAQEVLANLNRVLHGQITGFATCVAARITSGGTMTIANAGHIPPYRNGEEMAVQGGLPLGILPACKYEETQFEIATGDRLTLSPTVLSKQQM